MGKMEVRFAPPICNKRTITAPVSGRFRVADVATVEKVSNPESGVPRAWKSLQAGDAMFGATSRGSRIDVDTGIRKPV